MDKAATKQAERAQEAKVEGVSAQAHSSSGCRRAQQCRGSSCRRGKCCAKMVVCCPIALVLSLIIVPGLLIRRAIFGPFECKSKCSRRCDQKNASKEEAD